MVSSLSHLHRASHVDLRRLKNIGAVCFRAVEVGRSIEVLAMYMLFV